MPGMEPGGEDEDEQKRKDPSVDGEWSEIGRYARRGPTHGGPVGYYLAPSWAFRPEAASRTGPGAEDL